VDSAQFTILLKYWNGSFTAQLCSNDIRGQVRYLPCINTQMTDAFQEMYHFAHSKEESMHICGCKVNKLKPRSNGKHYFILNLDFISYTVRHTKKDDNDSIVVFASLPFESHEEENEHQWNL
jgi:hypothetical protein